jgi:Holliday junction resolvasome RuvABC DNA-binding subunit
MIIEYIIGRIIKIFFQYIVLLTQGGVGYVVYIELSHIAKEGDEISVWTDYRIATDNSIKIYGFLEKNSLSCFKMLCKINRVGPKLASKIIHFLGVGKLYHALHQQDMETIKGIPGVGAMTAKSILLEAATVLKDQLDTKDAAPHAKSSKNSKKSIPHDLLQQTLLNMGYDQYQVQSLAMSSIDPQETFDRQLIHALSLLSPFFSDPS